MIVCPAPGFANLIMRTRGFNLLKNQRGSTQLCDRHLLHFLTPSHHRLQNHPQHTSPSAVKNYRTLPHHSLLCPGFILPVFTLPLLPPRPAIPRLPPLPLSLRIQRHLYRSTALTAGRCCFQKEVRTSARSCFPRLIPIRNKQRAAPYRNNQRIVQHPNKQRIAPYRKE